MNEAIKLAIEKGGYIDPLAKHGLSATSLAPLYPEIAQDPLFWQALGKALGWEGDCKLHGELVNEGGNDTQDAWGFRQPAYLFYASQYFNKLLIGSDTEKFWKEILT